MPGWYPRCLAVDIVLGTSWAQLAGWHFSCERGCETIIGCTVGAVTMTVDPDAIYTVTSTTGQSKGCATKEMAACRWIRQG